MAKVLATPEEAYFEFFRADSAKDAEAWAAVMSYPHVRVSATGRSPYYETPEDYAARASWTAREATGWVRSRGIEPRRLHESEDKVHLAGGWTRFNAEDEPILRNRVTYILTRVAGSWGIQARFGTDSFTEAETVDAGEAAQVVEQQLKQVAAGDVDAACTAFALPLVDVGVGRVERHEDMDGLRGMLGAMVRPAAIEQIEAAQARRDGVVIAAGWSDADGRRASGVFLVARRESGWEIAATSMMAG